MNTGVHLINKTNKENLKHTIMKTIYTLSTIVLIALSLNSFADDKINNKDKSSVVSIAPFNWGEPDAAAPVGLAYIKAKNAYVPVAPFEWGNPDEAVIVEEKMVVPVAPFYFGSPDADAPEGLKFIKAKNAKVPVAPFIWGDSEEAAPTIL